MDGEENGHARTSQGPRHPRVNAEVFKDVTSFAQDQSGVSGIHCLFNPHRWWTRAIPL